MKIEIEIEDLRRLYDLATDSPLMCSGSFETDDVRVLRRLALAIGANISVATPDEFVRDFPHAFKPTTYRNERKFLGTQGDPFASGQWETEESALERLGGKYPDSCIAGSYGIRKCRREASHPIHQPGAPEPTSDPDAIDED